MRYVDKSTTAYTIIDENADSNFLNNNVLPILLDMGFYDENTNIVHQGHTGLMAKDETTTQPSAQPSTASSTQPVQQ